MYQPMTNLLVFPMTNINVLHLLEELTAAKKEALGTNLFPLSFALEHFGSGWMRLLVSLQAKLHVCDQVQLLRCLVFRLILIGNTLVKLSFVCAFVCLTYLIILH